MKKIVVKIIDMVVDGWFVGFVRLSIGLGIICTLAGVRTPLELMEGRKNPRQSAYKGLTSPIPGVGNPVIKDDSWWDHLNDKKH